MPDGKLDAYIACTPYVVRLTGDGAGGLLNPVPINLNLVPYLGATTQDLLVLMRRPDDNPVPLLVFQHAVGSFGRELCISYELSALEDLVCNDTPVQGPLVAGDLNGTGGGVPPDEIVASEGGAVMGIFGFAPPVPPNTPVTWTDSTRNVPGDPPGLESAAMGDLGNDGDLDVVVGQYVNSVNDRVDSIHYFRWDQGIGLEQIAQTLPSTPGLDAVAVADVDADGCNDIVGAGVFGRGMVHLGNAAGGFDGGQDLPQLGYQVPGTATRVGMAVGDLTGRRPAGDRHLRRERPRSDGFPQHVHHCRLRVRQHPSDGGQRRGCGRTEHRSHRDRRAGQRHRSGRRRKVRHRRHPDRQQHREDRWCGPDLPAGRGLLQRPGRCARHLLLHPQRRLGGQRRRHRPVRGRSAPASAAGSTDLHCPGYDAVHRRDSRRRRARGQQRPRRAQRAWRGRLPVRAAERRPADRRHRQGSDRRVQRRRPDEGRRGRRQVQGRERQRRHHRRGRPGPHQRARWQRRDLCPRRGAGHDRLRSPGSTR